MTELDTLKEKVQTIEIDKNNLAKRIEPFEAKQKYISNYHSDILRRENSLKNLIQEING